MKSKEEIEQLAENSSEVQEATYTTQHKITYKHGYIDGYKKCQEDMADKKYTLNDMKKACACGIDIACKEGENDFKSFEDLINSLNKQD